MDEYTPIAQITLPRDTSGDDLLLEAAVVAFLLEEVLRLQPAPEPASAR